MVLHDAVVAIIGGTILVATLKKHLRYDHLSQFFLTIIGCTFIIFSLISSKIDIYLIAAYPFIVYLGIIALQRLKYSQWMAGAIYIPALAFVGALPAFYWLTSNTKLDYLGCTPFYLSATVLTLAGAYSLFRLIRRHSLFGTLRSMSIALFVALFAGGWGIPEINDRLGYGELCTRSMELANRHRVKRYIVWRLPRPENMDVYLHCDVNIHHF